jgi:enoyl-CoA hydratase/carnithine racemase
MTAESAPVLFDLLPTRGPGSIAAITLNNPRRLNALDHQMIDLIETRLADWRHDRTVAAVWIRAAGERAFCAGGDIRNMVSAIAASDFATVRTYFASEYRLDHVLHTYPKPVVSWGQGLIMGGGLGLHQTAEHRIVTRSATLAMPEISIGLFPDVGAAWFLQRMPGRLGLFCGLTGVRLSAGDALHGGLADYHMDDDAGWQVLEAMRGLELSGNTSDDHGRIGTCLRRFHQAAEHTPLLQRAETINRLCDHRQPAALRDALAAAAADDAWFKPLLERVDHGSPTTFALVLEQFRRTRRSSLAEVLQLDLLLAMNFAHQHDFPEGVRALLLDKDGNPQWSPATLSEVTQQQVNRYFEPPIDWEPWNPA